MKFFVLVCIFGLVVGLLSLTGCAATSWGRRPWSTPEDVPEVTIDDGTKSLSARGTDPDDPALRAKWSLNRVRGGRGTGWESQAREIEKNLGYQ